MPRGKRIERVIDGQSAEAIQKQRKAAGEVITWTVTRAEQGYVARPACLWGPAVRLEAHSLEVLRAMLPRGLRYYPGDGEIEEVWI